MRDELFKYFVEAGHDLCYLRAYSISARRVSNAYSGFLMLVSAGGIVTLSCWSAYPVVWALIVVAAQVLQVLKPLMQAPKQREALKYIVQDISAIFDDVSTYWDTIGAYDPPLEDSFAIATKIDSFRQQARNSKARFATDFDFPFKDGLDKKARIENSKYFWYHYNMKIEEEFQCQSIR